MKNIFLSLFVLSLHLHSETVYVTKINQDKYITDDNEIIETTACLAFALNSDEAIIEDDRIVFVEDNEICDILSRSNPPVKQITYYKNKKRIEKSVLESQEIESIKIEVDKIKKEYPDFDLQKIANKLKNIQSTNAAKAEYYNNPIGWEVLHLKHFHNSKQRKKLLIKEIGEKLYNKFIKEGYSLTDIEWYIKDKKTPKTNQGKSVPARI